MATVKKQDMPPPGGYRSIPFQRVPAKKYFGGFTMFLGYTVITTAGLYIYTLQREKIKREDIEMRSSRIAMFPLLAAEMDREFLKQVRRNRDEEARLMANVPGWEVGTLFGEPIYKTLSPDTLVIPQPHEYYGHASYKDFAKKYKIQSWS